MSISTDTMIAEPVLLQHDDDGIAAFIDKRRSEWKHE